MMNKNMPTCLIVAALSLMTSAGIASESQKIITDDGREVILNDDGTWSFSSNDRFASTGDGRRIKLKDNGSWEYVGNTQLTTKEHVRTSLLDVKLQKVIIEKHEKKLQKNVRLKTQTVFELDMKLSVQAKNSITINTNNLHNIEVSDSGGKHYPVVALKATKAMLKPGSATTVTIRAKGAPLWPNRAKSISVKLNPDTFGLTEAVTLSKKVDDIEEKDVDGF